MLMYKKLYCKLFSTTKLNYLHRLSSTPEKKNTTRRGGERRRRRQRRRKKEMKWKNNAKMKKEKNMKRMKIIEDAATLAFIQIVQSPKFKCVQKVYLETFFSLFY